MLRRASDSSSTSNTFSSDSSFSDSSFSDSSFSDSSFNSTESFKSCCPPPIDLRFYAGKQAFSILVELSQQYLVSHPVYQCLGAYGAQQWLAKVTVTRCGKEIEGQGFAASKASAKSAAAEVVLAQLSGSLAAPPSKPTFHANPSDVRHLDKMKELADQATLSGAPTTIVSLDLEVHEHNHSRVLEIGIASLRLDQLWHSQPEIIVRHFIIEDFIAIRNGCFVDDKKFDFDFGVSEFITAAEIPNTIRDALAYIGKGTSIILAGHSISNDIRWINSLGTDIENLVSNVVDIALADKVCRQAGQVRGVESMLEGEGIVAPNLHNGGNDAVYTLEIIKRFLRRLALG